ncbi:hypothetical protein [Pedobacter sp. L105]|uniref:hypothetical protein n=1 Tax=Pedobacter sp. L105 TaxID=1641871 RepID=UPI00131AC8E4|nr:hypothetical protein [Pedobacter sp. L105]
MDDRTVYKLITVTNNELQGLISITDKIDHIYLHLIESSPLNFGIKKRYEGVGGNLIAYCCKLSFDNGNDGIIGFKSKTNLVNHYVERLGATHIGDQNMIIYPESAFFLINKYYSTINI